MSLIKKFPVRINSRPVALPAARVSGFDHAPGRVMGTGPEAGKPAGDPPVKALTFDAVNITAAAVFQEVQRFSAKGYTGGKIVVSVVATPSSANAGLEPRLYGDIRILGWTGQTPELLKYGATGQFFQGTAVTPGESDLSAPPVIFEWDGPEQFDEFSVEGRPMAAGAPLASIVVPPDICLVNVYAKLWR